MIYLDNAATTKPNNKILEAITPYIEKLWQNPSSVSPESKEIKNKIEEVRELVANSIGAKPNEIFFTSGATESNNWVLRGFQDNYKNRKCHIITTPIEHNSIISCLEGFDGNYSYCKIDEKGIVNRDNFKEMLSKLYEQDIKILASVIFGNNEIGTIQKIKDLSNLTHKHFGYFHTDATQVFGHIPIDVDDLGIDLMSCSSQKLNGLKGTGFLYKREGVRIKPLIYGSQENGMRGGTENVIGIIALGEAIKQINYDREINIKKVRDYMIDGLVEMFGCKVNGSRTQRLFNNISVTFPQKIKGEELLEMLLLHNVYCSSGSACNSYDNKPSRVLSAIGLTDEEINKTIRITLSGYETMSYIDIILLIFEESIKILSSRNEV